MSDTRHDTTVVPPTPEEQAYVLAVFGEVRRLLDKGRLLHADDLAQEIAGHTLAAAPRLMALHPDPVVYARRRLRHASISYDRTQRAQRGEGVRLVRDADGTVRPARRAVSGDAHQAAGGTTVYAGLADPTAEFEHALVGALDADHELRRLARGPQSVSSAEMAELLQVDGHGCPVQEVAQCCGQARETVSRRVNRTRARLRENRLAALRPRSLSG